MTDVQNAETALIVPEFTKKDYTESTAPYEWVNQFKHDKLKLQQALIKAREQAGAVGVKSFMTLYKAYLEGIKSNSYIPTINTTNFTDQTIELDCGDWHCDDSGISTLDKMGFEVVACNHPIMPVQRLINLDNGVEKLKIAFRKGDKWRTIIADKKTLASANAIIQLADYGIAVNSENAKYLVKYLTDIEHINYDKIKETKSVTRLGWIKDYGFSPYVDHLEFDGDVIFKAFFDSVHSDGDYTAWKDLASEIRKGGVSARIMLAASLASALVEPCGCNPFFVHLWGGTESGKTVALMLAASVWADPCLGRYIKTFNSTNVALELSAGFVNSMPLILDELQIIKDKKDFDNLIYQLSEGVGRSRGAKTGGLQIVPTWRNCILSTGEFPISNCHSGGGAVNRIIEINCNDEKIFSDAPKVADILKFNFGFVGSGFVGILQEGDNLDYAQKIYKKIYKEIVVGNTTEKQSAAAALILTADTLITEWLFCDGRALTVTDICEFLATKEEVSQNARALEFIYDFVAINHNRFYQTDNNGELWGKFDGNLIYIIKSQFDRIMSDNGYNSTSFLAWARQKNLIRLDSKGKNSVATRFNDKNIRCVCIKRPEEGDSVTH